MAKKTTLICDKCGSEVQVAQYSISISRATPYDVDLCGRCAEPLLGLAEIGREQVATWGGALTSASKEPELRSRVYLPEELDKLEEEHRKKRSKK